MTGDGNHISPGDVTHAVGTVRSQQGPIWAFLMHRVINPVMRRVLASRFHRLLGPSTLMVLQFRGRRSGRNYRFPIGYMQEGNTLTSYTPFSWWRNLEGGVPVTVNLRGRNLGGTADVSTDTARIAQGMAAYLCHNPGDAKFFYVSLNGDREPNPEDVKAAAQRNVQIRIELY